MLLADRILFIDAEALVVDKPAGLPVDEPNDGTLSVEAHLESLKFSFKRRPSAVHRLDRDTSGCLLLARSDRAHKRFQQAFEGGQVSKTYLAVLDGVPESVVIGLGLVGGGSVSAAMVAAVFLSNLPESIAATAGLVDSGWTRRRVIALWTGVTLIAGLATLAGYALFEDASPDAVAFVLAFAGGAILTMLADTMMPEAFKEGGRPISLLTALGFAVAALLSTLE